VWSLALHRIMNIASVIVYVYFVVGLLLGTLLPSLVQSLTLWFLG
jgi:hypothetical protein